MLCVPEAIKNNAVSLALGRDCCVLGKIACLSVRRHMTSLLFTYDGESCSL